MHIVVRPNSGGFGVLLDNSSLGHVVSEGLHELFQLAQGRILLSNEIIQGRDKLCSVFLLGTRGDSWIKTENGQVFV